MQARQTPSRRRTKTDARRSMQAMWRVAAVAFRFAYQCFAHISYSNRLLLHSTRWSLSRLFLFAHTYLAFKLSSRVFTLRSLFFLDVIIAYSMSISIRSTHTYYNYIYICYSSSHVTLFFFFFHFLRRIFVSALTCFSTTTMNYCIFIILIILLLYYFF